MEKQSGITLIALIITIIVMLILVGVTINVALNGGLFGSAEKAAIGTQIEAEREQLLSAVVTAYETETGTISKTKLESNLGADWNVEGDTAPYTVTSPKGNKYTVNENGTIDYTEKEEKSVAGENLGKYVTYQGISWIVLYDDADKVELITANALERVTLGYKDAGAKTNVTVANEKRLTDEEMFRRGAWSYNNVIETLTEACKEATGIRENIRNVGGPAIDTKTMKDTVVFSELTGFKGGTFENYEGETNGLKQEDENYLADYNQMNKLGILNADNGKDYWLASRSLDLTFGYSFNTRYLQDRCIEKLEFVQSRPVCPTLW